MSNARDKANIPALNFSSTGIDDNATSTAITISSSENVGIGTASPSQLLEIYGTSPNVQWTYSGDGNNHRIFSFSDDFYIRADANNTGAGNLVFQNGGSSERMRINNSGNVGIGTSSPGSMRLLVEGGNVYIKDHLIIGTGDSSTISSDSSGNPLLFGINLVEKMRINSSGNVGIGTTSPTQKLDVNGTVKATAFQGDGSALTGVGGANTPAFFAYLNTEQSASDNTITKVQIDQEDFDTDSCYDNSTNYRFTPTTAGKYYVSASVLTDTSAGGSNYIDAIDVWIYKNGSEYANSRHDMQDNEFRMTHASVEAIIDFNGSTDYVEVYARLNVNTSTPVFEAYPSWRRGTRFGAYKLIT